MNAPEPIDPPRRLTPEAIGERYNVKPRTAGDLLRRMEAAGVVRKIGKFLFGRLSACDAWVATGETGKSRRGPKTI